MINCPYDKFTLQVAIITAGQKIEKLIEETSEEAVAAKMDTCNPGFKEGYDSYETIANHFGVSTLELINSPNYEKLKKDYFESLWMNAIGALQKVMELTDKEAWAIMTVNQLAD